MRYLHYQPIVTLQKVFPKINTQELHKINKNIYENKHITDAYLEKGYFEAAKKFLSPEAFVAWMKNLKRMSVIYEVDKPVFYSPKDYFIFRDSLFIMDWAKEEAVEIKDTDVTNSMKQLFENLKSSSTRIDLSSIIKKYTEQTN